MDETNTLDYILLIIFNILMTFLRLFVNWVVVALLLYFTLWCFDINNLFNIKISIGVWVILIFIKYQLINTNNKKEGSDNK